MAILISSVLNISIPNSYLQGTAVINDVKKYLMQIKVNEITVTQGSSNQK